MSTIDNKGGVSLIKKLDKLYDEIEHKRNNLHERLNFYQDFTHPTVVQTSQELDELLNRINKEKELLHIKNKKIKQKREYK